MTRRILIVSNYFPPRTVGGAEIVAYRQARALARRGYAVVVLAGAEPSSDLPPGTLALDTYDGLPVYRLALRSLEPHLNFYWPAAARHLRALISVHDIGIVHFHNVIGLGADLIPAAREAGAACLLTLHDHWGFCFRNTRLRPSGMLCPDDNECSDCLASMPAAAGMALPMRLRRDYVAWCLGRADVLLTPSSYLARAYMDSGVSADRLQVLSNGIDLECMGDVRKIPSRTGKVRFLWSGYFGEHKGVPVLLEALQQLAKDPGVASRWEMTICGGGHLQSKIEATVKNGSLSQYVRLAGRLPRTELLRLFAETDVFVLTSVWPENEPVSLLEAIASGTAQIVTSTGGSPALVEEGQTGFLVNPGDAGELAEVMRRYTANPALASQHGTRNYLRRAQFDEQQTIDKLESILARLQTSAVGQLSSEPVVICGSRHPAPGAVLLLNQVHRHLLPGPTPRFLWHEWGSPEIWRQAALLWLWEEDFETSLLNRALHYAVPVLCPASDWARALARHYGGIILYHSFLEALASLRLLLPFPSWRAELSRRARMASAAAVAFTPPAGFVLQHEPVS